jgi:hypothetical protein
MEKKSVSFENIRSSSPIPREIQLNEKWGKEFSHECGIFFELPNDNVTSIFLDKRINSGDAKKVMEVFGNHAVAGHIVNCEIKEWTIHVEPTSLTTFGVIIYTAKNKPLMAGEGEVGNHGEWQISFRTLYPGIRNSRRVTVQGGVRGGTGQSTYGEVSGTLHF